MATHAVNWDLTNTAQSGQRTIYGRTALGSSLGLPLGGGDLNGDGLADLVLTPMNANSGPSGIRNRAGEAIILLSSGMIAGAHDLAALDPSNLPADATIVYGAKALDYFGTQVATGDVDGDGFDDAIVGAQHGDGPNDSRANCGEVVILWGSATLGGRVIDLATPGPEDDVTFIYGADAGDRFGVWVSTADFDGDGVLDVVIGADQGDGPAESRTHAGETYVVYGGPALRSRGAVDLDAPAIDTTVIYGRDVEDHSGCTVRGARMNTDNADEILIGAGLNRLSASADPSGGSSGHAIAGGDGPTNGRPNAGEAYVVYGTPGVRPASIDLRTPPSSTVIVYGPNNSDSYGEEVFGGDFNGDGLGDLVVGALTGSGPFNDEPNAGELALIYGSVSLPGSIIDLASPPPGITFIYGAEESDITADTVTFTDLDLDGRDDLLIASPLADTAGRTNAGKYEVIFGRTSALPSIVDLASPPPGVVSIVIQGAEAGDLLAYSAGVGDVNGDGFPDAIFNAMGADGLNNARVAAGDAYVLSGRRLSELAGRSIITPTPSNTRTVTLSPTITPTRTVTPTPTVSPTFTMTLTPSLTGTPTRSPTRTSTRTATSTRTQTPTGSTTSTQTPTGTHTFTRTSTSTPTRTPTHTPASSPTASNTFTNTPTVTPTATPTPTRTATSTPSSTRSVSPTRTPTNTFTFTATRTSTPTPTGTRTSTPTHTVRGHDLTGTIRAYVGDWPVAGATVELIGTPPSEASTASDGTFAFTRVPSDQRWTIEPSMYGSSNGAITSLDATYVLQFIVGRRNLTTFQQLVCDVTGDGSISASDGAKILQLVVGRITTFPVTEACGSEWVFEPAPDAAPNQVLTMTARSVGSCVSGAITFDPLTVDAGGQNFVAGLSGDCTGNWQPLNALRHGRAEITARVGRLRRLRTGRVRLPLYVQSAPLHALELQLEYDPRSLRRPRLHARSSAGLTMLAQRRSGRGRFMAALAGAEPLATHRGPVAFVEFEIAGQRADLSSSVRVTALHVDDEPVLVRHRR